MPNWCSVIIIQRFFNGFLDGLSAAGSFTNWFSRALSKEANTFLMPRKLRDLVASEPIGGTTLATYWKRTTAGIHLFLGIRIGQITPAKPFRQHHKIPHGRTKNRDLLLPAHNAWWYLQQEKGICERIPWHFWWACIETLKNFSLPTHSFVKLLLLLKRGRGHTNVNSKVVEKIELETS